MRPKIQKASSRCCWLYEFTPHLFSHLSFLKSSDARALIMSERFSWIIWQWQLKSEYRKKEERKKQNQNKGWIRLWFDFSNKGMYYIIGIYVSLLQNVNVDSSRRHIWTLTETTVLELVLTWSNNNTWYLMFLELF